jgi:hypothetical protein
MFEALFLDLPMRVGGRDRRHGACNPLPSECFAKSPLVRIHNFQSKRRSDFCRDLGGKRSRNRLCIIPMSSWMTQNTGNRRRSGDAKNFFN